MDINKFPNPKLNLPKELKDSANKDIATTFEATENYLNSIRKYLHTNINLNYERSDPMHIHAWIKRVVSANVLRSLYLRNAFVDAFNSRNTVGIFLPLKAWFETAGVLASILQLLESKLSPDDLFEKFQPYALGNRGKGSLRAGTINAISVATMMEKADKYMERMRADSVSLPGTEGADRFFTDFYDIASNPSHPSFDAYEVVGALHEDGIWFAKEPDDVRGGIVEDLPGYGGLLMAPLIIENICRKIYAIEGEYFIKLGSKRYFSDEGQVLVNKEVGGMKLPGGFAIGPMYFSKDGKTASAIMGPAINAFDYGITNSLNRLDKSSLSPDEFQEAFNSQIENLIAETLVYLRNRLKVISKTNIGEFSSVDKFAKEFTRQSINLGDLCNINFLLEIDRVRGRKHHSDRRYDVDYTIDGIAYDTPQKLRELNRKVYKEIHAVDEGLSLSHKDYEVQVTQTPNSMSVEFTANSHAFDLTREGKVVSKKQDDHKTDSDN